MLPVTLNDAQQILVTRINGDPVLFDIIYALLSSGYDAYVVGGCIRDIFLSKVLKDVDIATNATPDELVKLFKDHNVRCQGSSFLVVSVDGFDVATYRKDVYNDGLASDCVVERVKTIEEDLGRRDFTINAIAFDPLHKVLIDPYGGVSDLYTRKLRFVGDPEVRIKESYERILRACRFCINLGQVAFDKFTLEAIFDNTELLKLLPKEKIALEVEKAMKHQRASVFFEALYKVGALKYIFPSLVPCWTQDGGPHHAETVFKHNMEVGDALSTKNWRLKLAGYLHDVGKPPCAKIAAETMALRFRNHPEEGARLVYNELRELKFSNKTVEYVSSLIRLHMTSMHEDFLKRAVKRFMVKLENRSLDYRDWMRLLIADRKGNYKSPNFTFGEIRNRLRGIHKLFLEERMFSLKNLAINGKDVLDVTGLQPGPIIGIILNKLFDDCFINPDHNNKEYLIGEALRLAENVGG